MAEESATSNGYPPCPFGRCAGDGWILSDDGTTATKCDCLEPRLARARASGVNSGIPKRFQGVSFDRPPVSEMPSEFTDRLRKWIANLDRNIAEGRGLWLLGDVGTGKTTLSMLVTTEARRRNYSIAYYSAPRLLTKIRSTFNSSPGEQTYSELFEQLCSVDLLHIDDLGSENRSEWVLEQFYSIVNERYEREKSIIVTSNHLPGGPNYERIHQERERAKGEEIKREELLEDKIGARTVSRLNEICGDPVLMMGSDERWRLAPRPD